MKEGKCLKRRVSGCACFSPVTTEEASTVPPYVLQLNDGMNPCMEAAMLGLAVI